MQNVQWGSCSDEDDLDDFLMSCVSSIHLPPRRSARVLEQQYVTTLDQLHAGKNVCVTLYGRLPGYGCVTATYTPAAAQTRGHFMLTTSDNKKGLPATDDIFLTFLDNKLDIYERNQEDGVVYKINVRVDFDTAENHPPDGDHITPSLCAFPCAQSGQPSVDDDLFTL